MGTLRAAMVGFDIAPKFHSKYGAWGTTPIITETDKPLLTRCLVLEEGNRIIVWYSHDLTGVNIKETDNLRMEIAQALDLDFEQVVWSTSQTHSSPTLPGSQMPGGSGITVHGEFDREFCQKERKRFINQCIDAAKEAISNLQPVEVCVGRGYCNNIGYDSRLPMPTGGVKFSRNYAEAIQGGKYIDPTVGLISFNAYDGKTIGVVFNFACHPATMINDKYLSSDYVGTAREYVEEEIGGAPAMFIQGFLGNIHNYYMFGKPQHARITGARLGKAAVLGLRSLTPIRTEPMCCLWRTIELPCRAMYTKEELNESIRVLNEFIDELKDYEDAVWFGGFNLPEFFTVEEKISTVKLLMEYLQEGLRIIDAGEIPRSSLEITLGVLRIGDMAAVLSPGENFALTGREIRSRSPFIQTLICGDTNGLFGYIGNDEEIDHGGFETDIYWKILYIDGFRLALAKGSTKRIIETSLELLHTIRDN